MGLGDLYSFFEFVEAGDRSTSYPTPQAAATELVQGIIDLLDELGAVRIGEALDAQNPFLLESRFSHSSL
ncbi:MAG: imelysin family protein [Cyanobacteriota bacterium]